MVEIKRPFTRAVELKFGEGQNSVERAMRQASNATKDLLKEVQIEFTRAADLPPDHPAVSLHIALGTAYSMAADKIEEAITTLTEEVEAELKP